MNWFQRLFGGVKTRAHSEIKKLTQLDGKPGLDFDDIVMLLTQIRKLATVDAGGSEKHRMAVAWLVERLGRKIPAGFAEVVVYIAYNIIKDQLAKKK